MLYLLNAFVLAFAAFHWNRSGLINLSVIIVCIGLAVVNAAMASPFVTALVR